MFSENILILHQMFSPFCASNTPFYMVKHFDGIELVFTDIRREKIIFNEFYNMLCKYIKDNHYENICKIYRWSNEDNNYIRAGDILCYITVDNTDSEEFKRIVTLFKLEGKI